VSEDAANGRDPSSGDGVSRDEGFRAWLAMNDYLVDEDFLVFDVEDMPEDPFTEEGLNVAEAEAIRRFPDPATALAEENREQSDKFIRFIGETFVRGLGGEWTDDAQDGTDRAFIGVRFDGLERIVAPPTLFTAALARRRGGEWAFVYHQAAKDLGRL
jgi:hypothetical protein